MNFNSRYNRVRSASTSVLLWIFLSFTVIAQQPLPPRKTLNLPNGAKPIPEGKYKPNWDSIRKNYRTPNWFPKAKFGIMMHWGLYAVPAYQSEWYPAHMYSTNAIIKYHQEKFGMQDKFGYKDFIPLFKAEKFDPAQWADLFKKSGARYVIPTAEHHDGFALYDSELTKWDAKDMGPKRDLIGELGKAVRRVGLKYGVSNHRMEHWSFMYPKDANLKTDLFDPEYADFYGPPQKPQAGEDYMAGKASFSKEFLEEWLRRCQELVDKYEPDIFWFDNGVNDRRLDPVKLRLAAYYYNSAEKWKKQVSLSTKSDAYLYGSIKDYERQSRAPKEITDYPWQVDDPVLNRFGYTEGSSITNVGTVVNRLIENVSKNGALLLNISPRADGTIPENQQNLLLEIGKWLDANGEGIYGTHAWTKFGEGGDDEQKFRFTVKKDTLYAFATNRRGTDLLIKSLPLGMGKIKSVSLLANKTNLKFSQNENGLSIKLTNPDPGNFPVGLKIKGLNIK
ncbi:MAG: alpha-L-fucosidase [Pyrinomonadaceae bacterium]|nr:alpha-L-fucosidase [Pyrinomonadaceae bacterium]